MAPATTTQETTMNTTQTYAITITGEQTNWKPVIVAEYDAENERAALGAYYSDHHKAETCKLGGIFKITHMTINGTRYIAMPLEWVTA
jgi:hypothetical protein